MVLIDQELARGARMMHLQYCHGVVAANSTFRQGKTMVDTFGECPLQTAFVFANELRYRLSDPGYYYLVDHWVEIIAADVALRDRNAITAAKIALMSYAWMHTTGEVRTTADEYEQINLTLGRRPPSYREYTRVYNLFVARVRALTPAPGAEQPIRAQYHHHQLHYLPSAFVPDAAQEALTTYCDFGRNDDIADHGDFNSVPLEEDAWTAAWRGAPLATKLRFYEFCARVDDKEAFVKANSCIYGGIIAICKGGNATEEWMANRIARLQENHGLILQDRVVNNTVMAVVYREYVVGAKVTTVQLYNYLLVWNHTAHQSQLDTVKWMIEQTAMVGASALSLIASTITENRLTAEMLLAAGVPAEEFRSFAEAICHTCYDKLGSMLTPVIESVKMKHLIGIGKEVNTGSTFKDLLNNSANIPGVNKLAKVLSHFLRTAAYSKIASALDPATLARNRYGIVIEQRGNDVIGHAPDPEAPQQDVIVGTSVVDVLAKIPPSAKDRALEALCDAAIGNSAQSKWTLIPDVGAGSSPYRAVPEAVVAAARVFGYEWEDPQLVYVRPFKAYTGYIQPAYDLGCWGGEPLDRPAQGRRPPGGGPGGNDDDEDQGQWRPFRPLTPAQLEQELRQIRQAGPQNRPRADRPRVEDPPIDRRDDDDNDDDRPQGGGGPNPVVPEQPELPRSSDPPAPIVVPQGNSNNLAVPGPSGRKRRAEEPLGPENRLV